MLQLLKDKKKPVWISNIYSRQQVHQLRAQEQGIVIGTTTALMDNPSLTTRQWAGTSPTRLVIDKNLKIPKTAAIFNDKAPTIILTQVKQETTHSTPIMYEYITFEKKPCHTNMRYCTQSTTCKALLLKEAQKPCKHL